MAPFRDGRLTARPPAPAGARPAPVPGLHPLDALGLPDRDEELAGGHVVRPEHLVRALARWLEG